MVSRKSGSSGKSGDGGEAGWFRKSKRRRGDPVGSPSAFTEREMRYFKGPCRRRALLPRVCAAKGLRRQGAVPPRGCAAKGFATKGLRRQGLLSPKRSAAKGGNQARCLLPRTRTAPARAATVIRLSHRPMAAPSAVLGLSVPLLPVSPPLLALGSAAPQTVHLPSL